MTPDILRQIFPAAPSAWLDELVCVNQFDGKCLAMFLATLGEESKDFTHLQENLSYSAERLMEVWPKRFPTFLSAAPYQHSTRDLANRVYANRMGNGDETSGDGFRYRGRGPIQITGHDNYQDLAAETGMDVLKTPDLLLQPHEGIRSAVWYWNKEGLPKMIAKGATMAQVTAKVNGGQTGEADRELRYHKAAALLGVTV